MDRDYIVGLLETAAAEGVLRLGLFYIDGQPAAGQIWLVSKGTAYNYRLAYDPRFKKYSIGTLLTHAMFRHVIDEDKAERIDLGIGDEAFKKDWVEGRREFWGIAGYNRRTWAGLRTAGAHLSISAVKRVLVRLGLWKPSDD